MARKGKIAEIYDLGALEKQQDRVLQLLGVAIEAINKFPKVKIDLEGSTKTKDVVDGMNKAAQASKKVTDAVKETANAYDTMLIDAERAAKATNQNSGAYDNNVKKLIELKNRLAEVNKTIKALQDLMASGVKSDQISEQLVEATKSQAQLKLAIKETTTEMNRQTKENSALKGSLASMDARLALLVDQYYRLDEVDRNSQVGEGLLKQIQELDKTIKVADFSMGKFQRNVGNYSGAVQILEKELAEVRKKMDDFNKSGQASADVVAQLVKEEKLLEQLVNNQVNGFASATAELKNNEKALQALGAAGQQNTVFYQELLKETAQLKDNVGDLKAEIKNLASDTGTLDGLVQGAQALAGIYGVAQGAAALFGDENEELQKTMVKLQAVTAILTGLQGLQNALQKESSFRLLLNNGLKKIDVLQTNLQSAAESKNIIVRYGAIAAQKALNAVMAANPIGLLVVGLVGLGAALVSFTSKAKDSTEEFEKFNAAISESQKRTDAVVSALQKEGERNLNALKEQFATERQLRDARIENLELQKQQAKQQAEQANAAASQEFRLFQMKEEHSQEELQRHQDTQQNKAAADQKYADITRQINNEISEGRRAAAEQDIEISKQMTEGLLNDLKRRSDALQEQTNNEKFSYKVREDAAMDFAATQLRIAQIQKATVLADPRSSDAAKLAAEQKFTDDSIKIAKARSQKLYDIESERLNKLYDLTQRQRDAAFELARINIEASIQANSEIIQNESATSSERLKAVADYYKQTEQLIKGQMEFELSNTKLLESEKTAIRARANADLMAAQRAFLKQYTDMSIEELRKQNTRVETQLSTNQKNQQAQLLRGLRDSLRFQTEFYSEQQQLQDEQDKEALVTRARNLEQERRMLLLHGRDVTEINNQIADAWVAIEQKTNEILQKEFENRIAIFQKVTSMALDVFSTIGSALDVSNEREKNRIQEQIDLLEKKKQVEIENANATIANEQDKAAAITVIEKRAQAQREQLEFRQRQIEQKRARFQKAMTIAQIIADTAAAIMKTYAQAGFFGGLGGALAVGALGAAKLAIAIATPIPKYKTGTQDHKGGLAVVGDGGKREVIQTPSGDSYVTPNRPTLVSMPKHSKVLPDADAVMEGLKLAAFRQLPVERVNEKNYAKEMTAAITGRLDALTSVVKRKKELSINITRYGEYLKQKSDLMHLTWHNNNMQSRQ